MRSPSAPGPVPDGDAGSETDEQREFTIHIVGRRGAPREGARLSRVLAVALFVAVAATSLVTLATGNADPVPPIVWLSTALGPFALAVAFHVARLGAARARARAAAPKPTRVRVVRHSDRTGSPAGEAPELIPGARPVPPSAVLGEGVGRGDRSWSGARQRFARLRGEYAAFECDPMRVLRLPALTDVSVPSTARFVDAFADAQSLATDRYPGSEHARRFITAADHAARTWTAAREAAERIRLSGLTPAERRTVERVIKLLTTARESDSEPERLVAYARARTELAKLDRDGVVHVPRAARAALGDAARGQLPG
ncbi:hypothetical protein [Pseudonocardia lacus]|uniref:hypothetical protein n=1 Tax=Pseudonocardia lacus TaxID=2835865 RepID=UPI001BDCE473|nr:hypothetical protein [Pseudonocardia lacus]